MKENDGVGVSTCAHGNGRPARSAATQPGGSTEAKGSRTGSATDLDQLRDSGTKDNGSKEKESEGSELEVQGAKRDSRGKKKGEEENKVSGIGGLQHGASATDLKGSGGKEGEAKGLSDEKGWETRLERLRNTNYREYWRKGGRGSNPNRAVYDDKGGEEEHMENMGGATKKGDGEGRKDASEEWSVFP